MSISRSLWTNGNTVELFALQFFALYKLNKMNEHSPAQPFSAFAMGYDNKNWNRLNIKPFEWMWIKMERTENIIHEFSAHQIRIISPHSTSLAHFCMEIYCILYLQHFKLKMCQWHEVSASASASIYINHSLRTLILRFH